MVLARQFKIVRTLAVGKLETLGLVRLDYGEPVTSTGYEWISAEEELQIHFVVVDLNVGDLLVVDGHE